MADKWDLTKIYPTEKDFDADLKKLKEQIIPSLASHKGKLAKEDDLKAFLAEERELECLVGRLYLYAECASDIDKRVVKNNERLAKVRLALNDLSEATAFEDPEILALGEKGIADFIKKNPDFKDFDHSFAQLFLESSHILSADKEQLASSFSPLLGEGSQLYSMKAMDALRYSDVLIVGGTSLNVYPAAGLIQYFGGQTSILINKEATDKDRYFDYVIHDDIGTVLTEIML